MKTHRLERVLRTTWGEPAVRVRAKQKNFRRGNHAAVKLEAKDKNVLGGIHGLRTLSYFINRAFRKVVKKSFSTSANPLPAIEGRATSTSSSGWVSAR